MKLYWMRLQHGATHMLQAAAVVAMALAALMVIAVVCAGACATGDDEAAFLAENEAATTRMMAAMTIKPSGDVDKDFVAVMVPHHQGAIEMAQAELRHGRNEQLRRIAQEIIVEQRQEIAAMHLAVGAAPPRAAKDTKTTK